MKITNKQNKQTNMPRYAKWKSNVVRIATRGRIKDNEKVDELAFLKALDIHNKKDQDIRY
tara:strand:- start:3268 stop:3447 length:180 start_codon:yes stop_codon:yes gene_type:complete